MPRRALVLACSLIGALGGALFAMPFVRDSLYRRMEWSFVAALTICTGISATLLGLVLARRPRAPHEAGGFAAGMSALAGAFNGVLMVCAITLEKGSPGREAPAVIGFAVVFGAICSIPFIPAIVAVAVTAANVTAREGSMAAVSQQRRVLRNACIALTVAAVMMPPRKLPLVTHVPTHVLNIVFALAAALLILELGALRHLERLAAAGWERVESLPASGPMIDLGVGEDLAVQRHHEETYRSPDALTAILRGDAAAARAVLTTSLRGHVVAASIALAGIVAHVALR